MLKLGLGLRTYPSNSLFGQGSSFTCRWRQEVLNGNLQGREIKEQKIELLLELKPSK